jgi:hypothetical protein
VVAHALRDDVRRIAQLRNRCTHALALFLAHIGVAIDHPRRRAQSDASEQRDVTNGRLAFLAWCATLGRLAFASRQLRI